MLLGVGVGVVRAQQARVELREEVGAAAALQGAGGWGVRLGLLREGVRGRVGVVVWYLRREDAARDRAVDVRLLVLSLLLAWTFPALVVGGVGHCGGSLRRSRSRSCVVTALARYARPTAERLNCDHTNTILSVCKQGTIAREESACG